MHDLANSADAVLAAIQTYCQPADPDGVTDPNAHHDVRAKLDIGGWADSLEAEADARLLMDPRAKQWRLQAAPVPVAGRLLKRFSAAKAKPTAALDARSAAAAQAAMDETAALTLFKSDLGAFIWLDAFISRSFDYGSNHTEKRFVFFKPLSASGARLYAWRRRSFA